jgi:hypothetical protein
MGGEDAKEIVSVGSRFAVDGQKLKATRFFG